MDITDISRAFHLKESEYIFFSHARGKFSRIDHKANLSKFKNIKIISSIFSNQNTVRIGVNYREKKL